MPVPPSHTLQAGFKFREKLDPTLRGEFDQFVASLQQQVGGLGVIRHIDPPELQVTASGGGRITLRSTTIPNFIQLSYALIGQDLMLVNFYFLAFSVAGGPKFIEIRLPLGYAVKTGEWVITPVMLQDNGVQAPAQAFATNGVFPLFSRNDCICIQRLDGAALTNCTNGSTTFGQILFPVTRVPKVQ